MTNQEHKAIIDMFDQAFAPLRAEMAAQRDVFCKKHGLTIAQHDAMVDRQIAKRRNG